ncbi:MAG TPA: NADP-dependent oxidoreductase [Bacteroidales bacterium]|nr:NADP-dependent oxidoreductase [Bacteroidales bacterium]
MKASFITAYGGKEVISYGDLKDPELSANGVLVRVKASSINPLDYKIKSGALKFISPAGFPRILGSDFSGIIEKTGAEVSRFRPGDKVYGAVPVMFGKPGALAELVLALQENLRLMPGNLSFEEAASLPVGALTALSGLRKGETGPGKKVLVNGATGGVGHFGVQIAKAMGAYVTATCSSANSEFARSLGADRVTGYSKEELLSLEDKYDLILDAYGKMDYPVVYKLLGRGGTYASTLFMPYKALRKLFSRIAHGKTLTSSNMRALPGDYDELEKLLAEKKVKPFIGKTFTLDQTAEAFEYAEKGHPRGKIIVTVNS